MERMPAILTGFGLAVVLTILPFGAVAGHWLPRGTTLWLIAVAAILQIAVHLHFFLGIGLSGQHRERRITLLFACVLMFIMVGGTLWVMNNLYGRMM